MEEQAHKPHRKAKDHKDKEKKKHTGGMGCRLTSSQSAADLLLQKRIQKHLPFPIPVDLREPPQGRRMYAFFAYTLLVLCANNAPRSKRSVSMFPSSTDSPMKLRLASSPSSALPASARPPSSNPLSADMPKRP